MGGITGITNTVANSIRSSYAEKSDAASQSAARISSGTRLNKASVDASSLAISEKIRAKVGVLQQSLRNVNQGASTLSTAIGGMKNIQNTVVTMKSLSAKANNDIMDTNDFAAINAEYQKLLTQIDKIAETTRSGANSLLKGGLGADFNATSIASKPIDAGSLSMDYSLPMVSGSKLLVTYNNTNDNFEMRIDTNGDGTADVNGTVFTGEVQTSGGAKTISFTGSDLTFKTGSTFAHDVSSDIEFSIDISGTASTKSMTLQTAEKQTDTMTLEIAKVDVAGLLLTGSTVDSKANAVTSSATLDSALSTIQSNIAKLGAQQKQFEITAENVGTSIEANEAARAVYADTDVAEEITNLTQANVFAQLSTQMLQKALEMQQQLVQMGR